MPIPTNTSVTVQTRGEGAEDDYGITAPTWSAGTVYTAWLEQTTEVEVTEGQDTSTSDWLLCINGSPAVGHRDRVVEGGRTFEVVGTPDVKKWPGGGLSHAEIRLRLVV